RAMAFAGGGTTYPICPNVGGTGVPSISKLAQCTRSFLLIPADAHAVVLIPQNQPPPTSKSCQHVLTGAQWYAASARALARTPMSEQSMSGHDFESRRVMTTFPAV